MISSQKHKTSQVVRPSFNPIIGASSDFVISTISEYTKYNQNLHQRTLFPYVNTYSSGKLSRISVSFRFRSIEFNKKRALPFFLARELLTQRKCVASLSKRNVQA